MAEGPLVKKLGIKSGQRVLMMEGLKSRCGRSLEERQRLLRVGGGCEALVVLQR